MITLNGIFKDGMVFQWGAELCIVGSSDSSTDMKVKASLLKGAAHISDIESDIDRNGTFFLAFPPVDEPGGPYKIEIKCGEEKIALKDCYAGEVWLATGQSNIEYPLQRTKFAKREIENMERTEIRFYNVPAPTGPEFDEELWQREQEAKWVTINARTAGEMSGIAYYFAKYITTHIDCKVGIIGCYLGGTSISSWMSEEALKSTFGGTKILENFNRDAEALSDSDFDKELIEYQTAAEEYRMKVDAFLQENPYGTYHEGDEVTGLCPGEPIGWRTAKHPGSLFENMVKRIVPFVFRGVIYYQGENDCEFNSKYYAQAFTSLINEWRETFAYPDMPFVFAQLPMFISKEGLYTGDDLTWAELRQQQQIVAIDVPGTYMAVLADTGEFDNIHPADKRTPGERLAKLALKFVYGIDSVQAVAPYITDIKADKDVVITFAGDFDSLVISMANPSDDTGFEVAGEDNVFYPASVVVNEDGKSITLTCSEVEFPVNVRYAYRNYGHTPLHARNGLAAAPFSVTVR